MMIGLLTDFGRDSYVGIMKGVIKSTHEESEIIDIMHDVAKQNVRNGAWHLLQSYKFFPKHTVFCAVVDPGVGSKRKAIAIETRNYIFVGPDNGLLYPAAKADGIIDTIQLEIPKSASKTFHGRDVFAKAAAWLDSGKKLRSMGKKTDGIEELSLTPNNEKGEIVHIDSFGNIITNIKPREQKEYKLRIKNQDQKMPFYETYSDAKENELFLIIGSANTLEISMKNASAQEKLKLILNDKIEIS